MFGLQDVPKLKTDPKVASLTFPPCAEWSNCNEHSEPYFQAFKPGETVSGLNSCRITWSLDPVSMLVVRCRHSQSLSGSLINQGMFTLGTSAGPTDSTPGCWFVSTFFDIEHSQSESLVYGRMQKAC